MTEESSEDNTFIHIRRPSREVHFSTKILIKCIKIKILVFLQRFSNLPNFNIFLKIYYISQFHYTRKIYK